MRKERTLSQLSDLQKVKRLHNQLKAVEQLRRDLLCYYGFKVDTESIHQALLASLGKLSLQQRGEK